MNNKDLIITEGEPEVLPAIADNTLIAVAEQADLKAMREASRISR